MTAEIAILNKLGVALAADSAVTISSGGNSKKIYNSANKLFSLSKYEPVCIMVFDSAEFMGTPWETIIKLYRKNLEDKTFNSLKEYCADFFGFIEKKIDLTEGECIYVHRMTSILFEDMVTNIDEEVESEIKAKGKASKNKVRSIIKASIDSTLTGFNTQLTNSDQKEVSVKKTLVIFEEIIANNIQKIFEKRPLSKAYQKKLLRCAAIFSLLRHGLTNSGVVFAGFGVQENYPSVYGFSVGKSMLNKVTRTLDQEESITQANDASILPFAHSAEVSTFMEGMGNDIKSFFYDKFRTAMSDIYPSVLTDTIETKLKMSPHEKSEILDIIKEMDNGICDLLLNELSSISTKIYSRPVVNAVGFLSVSDLATMAETFINLESFRKKMTFTTETVGGPIDVAVITKGDGVIWIKRKHYFDKELNHHFFSNYF